MNNDTADYAPRKQKWILILLLAMFLLPMGLSYYLFYFTSFGEGGGDNHGNLVQPPRQLPNLELLPAGEKGETSSLYGKWTLVYLLDGGCGSDCERNLYRMRQLRLAQGRHGTRVQRLLLGFGDGDIHLGQALLRDYPGQLLAPAKARLLDSFRLSEGDRPLPAGRLYLVDPRGFLMMSYAPDAGPGGIIDDLERLLRYSSEG